MKIDPDDYYLWSCDWCDTENVFPWVQLQAGAFCAACQRPLIRPDTHAQVVNNSAMGAGRCQPCSSC
jgi:hypothetical protein